MRGPIACIMEVLERTPTSILICCTNNALRSPMADGMVKFLQGHVLSVSSVGIRVGTLDQFAVSVMDEVGIDISTHCPKSIENLTYSSFDLILSLSPGAQYQAVDMSQTTDNHLVFWNTFDPSTVEGNREIRLAAYREVWDTLFNRFKGYFVDIGLSVAAPNI